jgi:hypothetical protein
MWNWRDLLFFAAVDSLAAAGTYFYPTTWNMAMLGIDGLLTAIVVTQYVRQHRAGGSP